MIAIDTALEKSGLPLVFAFVFFGLMVCAVTTDIRCRRIPNSLALITLVLGAVSQTVLMGPRAAWICVLEGSVTGLLIWLPFWLSRMMGAGDVKFFAASASWLGPLLALKAALFTALFGGVLALAWLILRRGPMRESALLARGISDVRLSDSDIPGSARDARTAHVTLPYGVAMAAGLEFTAWFPHFIR